MKQFVIILISSLGIISTFSQTYNINIFYSELGGYVIQVNSDNTQGLVVAMQDQGSSSWPIANNLANNPKKHTSDGSNFNDWRLPTKTELNLIYKVYKNGFFAGSFKSAWYWSSNQYILDESAWKLNFTNGVQNFYSKVGIGAIRAVRTF